MSCPLLNPHTLPFALQLRSAEENRHSILDTAATPRGQPSRATCQPASGKRALTPRDCPSVTLLRQRFTSHLRSAATNGTARQSPAAGPQSGGWSPDTGAAPHTALLPPAPLLCSQAPLPCGLGSPASTPEVPEHPQRSGPCVPKVICPAELPGSLPQLRGRSLLCLPPTRGQADCGAEPGSDLSLQARGTP